MPTRDRERAVLQAAELYHLDGLTQAAVAERLGVTRWTVSRLLQEAEEKGIVETRIDHPHARIPDLEAGLREKFGLAAARVVPTLSTRAETFILVARSTADFLANVRPQPGIVAVGWGKTTAAVARAMKESWNPGVQVAQMNVAPAEIVDLLARGPVRILAARGPGSDHLLEGPAVARSSAEASTVMNTENNRKTLSKARKAEAYLYSPQPIEDVGLFVRAGGFTHDSVSAMRRAGAVGSILCRFIDPDGEVLSEDLEGRTIGLPLENLRSDAPTITAGYGMAKVPAFRAALKAGLANVLITDESPARALLGE